MDEEIDVLHAVGCFGNSRVRYLQAHCENDWDSIYHLGSEPAGMGHKHHRASMGRTVLFRQILSDLHMHVLLQGERWAWWTHTENSTSGLDEMEDFDLELNQYLQGIAMLEDIRHSGRRRE
jgi:hypothetical protein